MKRIFRSIDLFILGGWIGSLFAGIITPNYIKLIVSALDVKIISIGSLIASLFPFLTGLFFENRRLVRKLYALLPLVMLAELALNIASIFLYSLNSAVYYLASMMVFGLFSSTVMYLLQILKQRRYRRKRASFDRRYAMADASGYLVGSLLVFTDWSLIRNVHVLLGLGLLQTALVYLLFLYCYRRQKKVPAAGRRAKARKSLLAA